MAKLDIHENNGVKAAVFYCPGCKGHHSFRFEGPEPCWQWNGDMERPTFSPSLLVNKSKPESRCHLFLRDGRIQFLSDCHQNLADKTVNLEELED